LIALRTEISAEIIGLGVLVLLVLGVVTIGSKTVRAAFDNPVDNLKNDQLLFLKLRSIQVSKSEKR
jgi:putative ABC transport system permease protein